MDIVECSEFKLTGSGAVVGDDQGVPEGVVFEVRHNGATTGIEIFADISIPVIGGIAHAIGGSRGGSVFGVMAQEQTADSAGALERSRKIEAPEVFSEIGSRRTGLLNDIPAVVDEVCGAIGVSDVPSPRAIGDEGLLPVAATEVVVSHFVTALGRHARSGFKGDEAVLGVPFVEEVVAIIGEIAIEIVDDGIGGRRGRGGGVLVEGIG